MRVGSNSHESSSHPDLWARPAPRRRGRGGGARRCSRWMPGESGEGVEEGEGGGRGNGSKGAGAQRLDEVSERPPHHRPRAALLHPAPPQSPARRPVRSAAVLRAPPSAPRRAPPRAPAPRPHPDHAPCRPAAPRGASRPPPPPPPRTKWTRRVPHPVLIGHAASLEVHLAASRAGQHTSLPIGRRRPSITRSRPPCGTRGARRQLAPSPTRADPPSRPPCSPSPSLGAAFRNSGAWWVGATEGEQWGGGAIL